ncbi:MAG: hypothetical protein M9918_13525 [Anaerolineae bacterium]|nr:hypothetical protein [Anaerolineae bacterium]
MNAEEKRTESGSAETNTTTHSRVDMHAPDGDINIVDSKIAGRDIVEAINHYHEIIIRVDNFEDQPPVPGEPPYKGMAYYTEQDKDNYFGRELLSDHLAARLQTTHFLALIGASGSGKSSLLRAGIIPRLRARNWRIHIIKPGVHPISALADTLTHDELLPAVTDAMRDALLADPETLHKVTAKLASRNNSDRFLLVVDQFEELFTQCKDERERAAFVANLVHAAGAQSAITVLPSLRADFYDRVSEFPALTDLVSQQQEYVKPMAQEDLVRVIFEPAQRGGWQLVDGLVEQILDDAGHEPGRLPLLSHALLETWERRRGVVMTLGGYRAAGGVEGAIAHTADATLAHMSTEQQAIARDIFLSLTELGEGAEDTRRVASLTELEAGKDAAAVANVLEMLVRARLITTDAGEVEVAHEALIRRWPRLKDEWLPDNRERLRFERQLAHDAAIWRDELDEDEDALYRGARLAQALELVAAGTLKPTVRSMAFLKASRELAQRQEREREAQRQRQLEQEQALAEANRKRAEEAEVAAAGLRRRLYYALGAVALAMLLAIVAFSFFQDAQDNLGTANIRGTEAAQSALVAEAQRDTANAESTRAFQQQATATVALGQADEQRQIAVREEARAVEALATATVAQGEAERQSSMMQAQSLAIAADAVSQDDQVLAAQLAVEANSLAAVGLANASVYRHAGVSNRPAHSLTHDSSVWGATWNSNESLILTWSDDGTARVWEAGSATPRQTLAHDSYVRGATWNADESLILTWSDDGTARVWEAGSDTPRQTLAHDSWVRGATWNADESLILTWSGDGTARVWEAGSDTPRQTLAHDGSVIGATWNADESLILTWSSDGTARVWETGSGAEVALLEGDGSPVTTAQWNRAESHILLTTTDGHAFIYVVDRDELRDAACRRIPFNLWWDDWRRYLPGQAYRCTCSDLPPHPTVLAAVEQGLTTIDPETVCAPPATQP